MHLFQLCGQRSSACEIILDRVYGLLSLAKNHSSLIPDYNKSPFQLYLDALQDELILTAYEPDLINTMVERWFSLAHIMQGLLNPYKRAHLSRICSLPDPGRTLNNFEIRSKGHIEVHALTNDTSRQRKKPEKFSRAWVSNLAIAHWDDPLPGVFLVNVQNCCAKWPRLDYSGDLTTFYRQYVVSPKSNISPLCGRVPR